MPVNKSSFQNWSLLIGLAIIWGSSFILIKKGLITLSPLEVGSLRIFSAAVFLFPFIILRFKEFIKIPKEKFFYIFLSGILGLFLPFILFPLAQTKITSGMAGILNATVPLFVVVIGLAFFQQKIKHLNTLGIFIALLGTIFLLTGEISFSAFENINGYGLFIILATFFYGLNINVVKFKLKEISAIKLTSISFFFSGIFSVVALSVATDFFTHLQDWETHGYSIMAIIILGVVHSALAIIIFNKLIKKTSPLFSGSVTYLIPPVSVVIGFLDGEHITLFQIASMGIILVGIYLVNKK